MIEKVFRFFNKNKLCHSLLFIFLIITSCDDKVVSLSEDSSITTNYIQKTFTLDSEKSIFRCCFLAAKALVTNRFSFYPSYVHI